MPSNIQQEKYQHVALVLSWVAGVYYLVAAGFTLLPLRGHPISFWERAFSALEMAILGSTNWLLLRGLALLLRTKTSSLKEDIKRRKFAKWLHNAAIGFPLLLVLANLPSWHRLYWEIISFGMSAPVTWILIILSIGGSITIMSLYFYFLLELMHHLL